MRCKEFYVTHPSGVKRVRVGDAAITKERGDGISVWGTDLASGESMLVFMDAADWDGIPWTEHGEGKA